MGKFRDKVLSEIDSLGALPDCAGRMFIADRNCQSGNEYWKALHEAATNPRNSRADKMKAFSSMFWALDKMGATPKTKPVFDKTKHIKMCESFVAAVKADKDIAHAKSALAKATEFASAGNAEQTALFTILAVSRFSGGDKAAMQAATVAMAKAIQDTYGQPFEKF